MTDEAYEKLFKPVMRKVMELYQPEAIVFQSGKPKYHAPRVSSLLPAADCTSFLVCLPGVRSNPSSKPLSELDSASAGADSLAGDRLGAFNLSMKVGLLSCQIVMRITTDCLMKDEVKAEMRV